MKRLAMVSMLFALAALTGCASKSTTVVPERSQIAYGCPVGNARVGSVEDLIAAKVQTAGDVRDVKVREIQCTMQNDLLRIDFTLANSAATVRRIAYRFDWIDRNGMKAWNDDSWKPVYLYEESRQTIVGMAPAATAVDFRLVLLDADKKR